MSRASSPPWLGKPVGLQVRVLPSSFYHLQSVANRCWAGGPGPCSLNHCPCYPELSTTEILLLIGKQQRPGRPWSAPRPATIGFSNVPLHIPLTSISLSKSSWSYCPSRLLCLGFKGYSRTLLSLLLWPPPTPSPTNSNQANRPWRLCKCLSCLMEYHYTDASSPPSSHAKSKSSLSG